MLEQILLDIKRRIEVQGLKVGGFLFDGTDESKSVTFGPVNPDFDNGEPLRIGVDFMNIPTPSLHRSEQGDFSKVTLIDPILGLATVERPSPYFDWVLDVHVHHRETRLEHERINGYTLNLEYLKNLQLFLAAMGKTFDKRSIADQNGRTRQYEIRLEGGPVQGTTQLAIHSIFRYRLTFPNVLGLTLEQVNVMTAYKIAEARDKITPETITGFGGQTPATYPAGFKITQY